MKKLTIALLAVAAVSAPCQIKSTWSATLDDPEINYWTEDTAVGPNGSAYVLSMGNGNMTRLTCYDGLGAHVWSKTFDFMDADSGSQMLVDSAGNLIVQYCEGSQYGHVIKFDGTTGVKLWDTRLIATDRILQIAMDGQENIVVLGSDNVPKYGPVVLKLSPAGEIVNTRLVQPDTEGFRASRLAVSANGQIFTMSTKHVNGLTTQRLEALTPNFTVKYATQWSPSWNTFGSVIASDRNGRVCAAEQKVSAPNTILIRTFSSTGVATTHESIIPGRVVHDLSATFDANGRYVLGTTGDINGLTYIDCQWFSATDTTLVRTQRSSSQLPVGEGANLRRLFADSFGQTYSYASVGVSSARDKIFAFDESRTAPLWMHQDTFDLRSTQKTSAAVGRWGQLVMASTIGDPESVIGVTSVKQQGLRNLTINGQSFTGGRTITGTVNFYSSFTAIRNVTMSSNTSFATIAPTSTIAIGSSQAVMSIDLQPTAVRRAVRIEGMYGGAKRSAVFYLEPPVASGLTVYPTSIRGGSHVNATARINGAAPTGGTVVSMSSSDSAAVVPTSVTVLAGATTKVFSVQTNVVSHTKVATLTATTGATSKTATLTITP